MGGVGRNTACAMLMLLSIIAGVNSYSKYGRGCGDIGCLPNEQCVMTSDACSYSQREGKECGSYPTCAKKSAGAGSSSSVHPSGSSLKPGAENTIFSPSSSNPTLNTHSYNHNNNNNMHGIIGGGGGGGGSASSASASSQNGAGHNLYGTHNHNAASGGVIGNSGGPGNGASNGGRSNPSIIDPHYVFGAPQSFAVLPNLPIFPFNYPTQSPPFQQFPQPNHPGSALSPGFPHGLQPVNPYNPSFVFGNQPNGFYAPAGTGGPPGGATINGGMTSHGINYGGALGGYQNPNMYNKPPPQYQNQNQNPYNRQTQSHPSSAVRAGGATASNWPEVALRALGGALCLLLLQQYQVVLGRGST